jgi:hypothetical protein
MKIADYGKAITSYIESPTTAQKLKSKESANLLAEIDFSGMTVPQLRILYERYTGSGAPRDPRELIIELKRLMKNLDQDGVPFATGGRVHLAEGSEDIVEPPKSMQVDTTTKGPDLFTLDKFKEKAGIYILALHNRAMPLENIKSALNKFTKQGLNDGTFTVDEAIKVVQNLKFEVEDRAQKQRLRDNIIAGTGTVEREDFAGGTKLMDEYLGAQKEYQKAVDDGFQGTFEEFLRYKSSGSFAEGGRVKFQDGTNPIPKAPDLRALAGEANRAARETAKAEYAKQIKTYIENEIKNFEKTKILPNEKYEIITKKILRDINLTETGDTTDFINDIVKQIDLPYYIDKKTGPKISTTSDAIDEKILQSFKKNYKTQNVAQIIENITGLNSRNPEHRRREGRLKFKVNKLIDRNIINKEDIKKGKSKPDLKINRPIRYTGFQDYEKKRIPLLEGLPDKEKYIAKRGKYKGKLAPHVLDMELLRFLNYDTIKGSLSPDFPHRLLPSFEHVEGVTPASIIGDSEGLRKVELNTRRYNWNRTDGMAGKSPLYRRVKNFLKTATAELKQKNKNAAKNALDIVNNVYEKVTKRFNRNRKELPFYKIKNNKVVETNLKGVVKPETLSKSYLKYFKNVATSATDNELNKIKKIQPAVHQVLIDLKNAKEADAVKLIKIKLPDIKKGQLFSFAGAVPLPEVELSPTITNAFKTLRPVLSAAGKTVAVADPIFAAMDFSKAVDTGVSGKQAASFTAKKFIQDIANLPRTIEDLAFTATEEGTFKNFGDKKEEDRLFKYEPLTFADKSLQADIDATAPEILKARIAKRDFDTEVLPNLTMVDDIDIPASKEEIGVAKDAFMQEKDVDLSVLEKPKKSPFGKYNEQIKKLVF